MFWNIAIAVVLASLAALVSGLAGHLAATKPWHKWLFWGVGVAMIILIGLQTYRNEIMQASLQRQLDKIQKNTEQPPQITIPSFPQHTRVAFEPVGGVIQKLVLTPFQKDEELAFNVGYFNGGDYTVRQPHMGAQIVVLSVAEHRGAFARVRRNINPIVAGGDLTPHTALAHYFTFDGPKLTDNQAQKLNSGEAEVCVMGFVKWQDATGNYETDCHMCFFKSGGVFNWHEAPENNRELKH